MTRRWQYVEFRGSKAQRTVQAVDVLSWSDPVTVIATEEGPLPCDRPSLVRASTLEAVAVPDWEAFVPITTGPDA